MKKFTFVTIIALFTIIISSVSANDNFVFVDCPDCFNGHSPACVCGGIGEYPQDCDLCLGVGTLKCDLCYGSGTYDGSSCNRCQGDGIMVCNGCNGMKKTVFTCTTPSCPRCGGTGGYPEGSPEHLKQLEDEGKLPAKTDEQQQKPEHTDNNSKSIVLEEPIIKAADILNNINDEKTSIKVTENLSISLVESSEEEIIALKNMSIGKIEEVIIKVDSIVKTAVSGKISDDAEMILEKLSVDNTVKINTIYFDTHESITLEFPVEVRITVNPEDYKNVEKGYAYHILHDKKTAEYLGEAKLIRDVGGNVVEAAFVTRGFSDFFIASKLIENEEKGDIPESESDITEDEATKDKDTDSNKISGFIPLIIAAIIVFIGAAGYAVTKKVKKQG